MKEAEMAQDLVFIDGERVHRLLDYPACIAAMDAAMRALSGGATRQLPRTMIHMGEGRTLLR
jgi:ornithine cyclodeaminase